MSPVLIALLIPFLGTALGSAFVFFMKREMPPLLQKVLLGFASGVMVAASVWSLIIPAIEMGQGASAVVPPVIGLLAPDNLPVAEERGDLFRHSVKRGLDLLSASENGFVMMIEGSCIDDWLHGNDIGKAMEELLDFDRTIGDVLQWAAADGHTLVVVTADHNTGALTLQDGNLVEGTIGVAFGSESHNGIAVPFYAWGPGSDAFTGIRENDEWGRIIASFVK